MPRHLAVLLAAAALAPAAHAQDPNASRPRRPALAPRAPKPMHPLRISDNKRHLVQADGRPFFYLGDTAWELFHRLDRDEAALYLQNRAAKRFTVIQAVVLAELGGLDDPNPYSHKPLEANDPTRPNEKYFEHVTWIVNRAGQLGLTIAMLPTWGHNVTDKNPIFNTDNARRYGEFLGRRFRDAPIIWVLGGDRAVEGEGIRAVWNAMAAGLEAGDGGRNLKTFHPRGGLGSSRDFHEAPWLDFNMWQTGHDTDNGASDQLRSDWSRVPVKPTMDGEPLYEDHPISFQPARFGYSQAADVRRKAYATLLAGGCGFTYGNHAVWQMFAPGRNPINGPLRPWRESLDRPGAAQMRHVRALFESRPMLAREPAPEMVLSAHNAGLKRIEAARASDGSYAIAYAPTSREIILDVSKMSGRRLRAWWFDPRTGSATRIGEQLRPGDNRLAFTPPNEGENQDWVLVIDDAARNFAAPGAGS